MIYSVLLVLERSSTNTAAEQQFHGFYRPKMVFTGEKVHTSLQLISPLLPGHDFN